MKSLRVTLTTATVNKDNYVKRDYRHHFIEHTSNMAYVCEIVVNLLMLLYAQVTCMLTVRSNPYAFFNEGNSFSHCNLKQILLPSVYGRSVTDPPDRRQRNGYSKKYFC